MNNCYARIPKNIYGAVLIISTIICLGFQKIQAQNFANGIEASGLQISETATIISVEPDNFPDKVGNLNASLEEHKTGPDVIFELQRDGVYWVDQTIENHNFRLHIRSDKGEGHPPIIRFKNDAIGEYGTAIVIYQDAILEGLFLNGVNEHGDPQQILNVRGEEAVLVFDEGWWVGDYFGIWFEGSNNSIYFTNSVYWNAGSNERLLHGRWLDTRGNNHDTIYMENSTVYNLKHAFIRNVLGVIKKIHINHVTGFNINTYSRLDRTFDLNFTNNLWINVFPMGLEKDNTNNGILRLVELGLVGAEEDRNLNIHNNNIGYLDEEYMDLIDRRNAIAGGIYDKAPLLNRGFDKEIVNFKDNFEERVEFDDDPDSETYFRWVENQLIDGAYGDDFEYPMGYDRWVKSTDDPAPGHFTIDHLRNFTYSSDSKSYSDAENGFPLGDLNWFPELKQLWEEGATAPDITFAEDDNINKIDHYKILGNYPNPFNPATNIVYEIASTAGVIIDVYNIMGQKVMKKDLGVQTKGKHEVTIDAGNLSNGVYLVRMHIEDRVMSHKITLVK